MNKIEICDNFSKLLDSFRINHRRCNPYHIQIQVQHNFYPSKKTYYNSESGKKFTYPDFKNVNEVTDFLSKNVK